MGQARGAILGGCVLVALVILAEYGAFEILGYQTFTTEIFTEFQVSFNVPTACALSLVLVLLSCVILGGEVRARGRGPRPAHRPAGPAGQAAPAASAGRPLPVVAAMLVLVGLALGVPIGAAVYWMVEGGAPTLTGVSILDAGWHTALYSGCAAALATLRGAAGGPAGGPPRRSRRPAARAEHLPGAGHARAGDRPGDQLLRRALRGRASATRRSVLLIVAYAILFFPLALVGVRASVAHAPVGLEEAARSLGRAPRAVFVRVTLPLIGPGLAAAFCLVFLACATELTATLVLVPTGVQTLATQFWAYQQNLSYGQAAPFALVIIAIAAVPSYILARYFDRLPGRTGDPR